MRIRILKGIIIIETEREIERGSMTEIGTEPEIETEAEKEAENETIMIIIEMKDHIIETTVTVPMAILDIMIIEKGGFITDNKSFLRNYN